MKSKLKKQVLTEYSELIRVALDLDETEVEVAKSVCCDALDRVERETLKEKEKWLGFFSEDISQCFIPKCSWCGRIATGQTVKGKHAQEDNHRPVNWGYYCRKCYKKGIKMEEEAMYG